MAKIPAALVAEWRERCETWLKANTTANSLDKVLLGRDAWTVGHRSGVVREAYDMDFDICDAHIQTALEKIFPKAVFSNKKVY